jgi:ornithine carbamoyltransferase
MDDVVDIAELTEEDMETIFERTEEMKTEPGRFTDALANRTLLMLFEKSSTRTRVSFEAGMTQLGGHGIYFYAERSQMSRGESMKDTGTVLSRYCDAIMARLYSHEKLLALRDSADIPVINGLTDRLHPCQAIGDLYTLQEKGVSFRDGTLAYVGDGNNVAHSLLQAAATVGMDVAVGSPQGLQPDEEIVASAREDAGRHGSEILVTDDPQEAVNGADAVYTDVWVSMGDEDTEERKRKLAPFQLDAELLGHARPDAHVMHCLPAHRDEEITAPVIDGRQSVIYDQAENRMHVQKAILDLLIRQ